MLEEMILSHSILIKVFLGFLVGGLVIPLMTANNPQGFKKSAFIYTLIFQALATMAAFTGLVAMVVGEFGMNLGIILMIVIWIILMYIEIRKHKLIKIANLENENTFRLLKGAFWKISILQILLVAIMVILKVMEVKGAVSLS
jgi:hypothetical protein